MHPFQRLPLRFGLLASLTLASSLGLSASQAPYADGQILVKFRPTAPGRTAAPMAQRAAAVIPGASLETELTADGWQLLRLPSGISVPDAVLAASQQPEVEYAEPNTRYSIPRPLGASAPSPSVRNARPQGDPGPTTGPTSDPLSGRMYDLERIGALEAWKHTKGSNTVVIATLDTGIDYTHPDLAANVWVNPDEIPGNRIDDDRNGFVDDIHGINIANNSGDPIDVTGHGTHVAGTIGAIPDNGIGIAGINWNVRIVSVRVSRESDGAFTGDLVRGLDYITALKKRGVNIVACNHSWGGAWPNRAISDAFARLAATGVINVCAAGNQRSDHQSNQFFPNEYNYPGMIRVAASEQFDHLASFSDFGGHTVDLAAPGQDIWSTLPGGAYAAWGGTSMATPHVTGALGLLFSIKPDLTQEQARRLLVHSVDPLPGYERSRIRSGGRLNVGRAVQWLVDGKPIPSEMPPAPTPLTIEPISRTPDGFASSSSSSSPSISDDGRFIAFVSNSTNIVAIDTNRLADVFLRDRLTQSTLLVTQSPTEPANGASSTPAISGDGTTVALATTARNLVSDDSNLLRDVYAWDRASGSFEWISRPDAGSTAGVSDLPSLSRDGRRIAFQSLGSLVADDQGDGTDIYVRDRDSGRLLLVSADVTGKSTSGAASAPSISADGRFVAFISNAGNLVADHPAGINQVYLRDLDAGTTELISVSSVGVPGNGAVTRVRLSADGRFIAFQSIASNLVPGAIGGTIKTFIHDRVRRETTLVNRLRNGSVLAAAGTLDAISADGRWVLFRTASTALPPYSGATYLRPYAWDRLNGDFVALAWNDAGEPLNALPSFFGVADQGALDSTLSADGRFVGLTTSAWNLVPGDGGPIADVFVADRGPSPLDLILEPVGTTNEVGRGLVGHRIPQTSSIRLPNTRGSQVFTLTVVNRGASNPAPIVEVGFAYTSPSPRTSIQWPAGTRFLDSQRVQLPALDAGASTSLTVSLLAFDSPRVRVQLTAGSTSPVSGFVPSDRVTAEITAPLSPGNAELVSRTWTGGSALQRHANRPRVSDDGNRVVFSTVADSVVPTDRNKLFDVFSVNRSTAEASVVSTTASGTAGTDWSIGGQVSGDGRFAVFSSWANNLGTDANFEADVFVKNLSNRNVELISRRGTTYGNYASASAGDAQISTDGRYVTYQSNASILVTGDTNSTSDVFQFDRQTSTTTLITRDPGGPVWRAGGGGPVASRSGRFVGFGSHATNGSGSDLNLNVDAFVWDRDTLRIARVSNNAEGNAANGQSDLRGISDDGRFVVIVSDATDLPGDSGTGFRYLLLDRTTGIFTAGSSWLPSPQDGWRLSTRAAAFQINPRGDWLLLGLERSSGSGETALLESRVELVHRETRARRLVAEGARGAGAPQDAFSEVMPACPLQQSWVNDFPGSPDARFIAFSAEGREGDPFVVQAYLADLGNDVATYNLHLTEVEALDATRFRLSWEPVGRARYTIEHTRSLNQPFQPILGPVDATGTAEVSLPSPNETGFFRVRTAE